MENDNNKLKGKEMSNAKSTENVKTAILNKIAKKIAQKPVVHEAGASHANSGKIGTKSHSSRYGH